MVPIQYLNQEFWLAANLDAESTNDQRLFETLPNNCGRAIEDQTLQLHQAVVRTTQSSTTTFKYDAGIFKQWREINPMQLSFILVHEWLWGMVEKADDIRRLNQFLHRASTSAMTAADFQQIIPLMGLKARPKFEIAAGNEDSCALKDGKLFCWPYVDTPDFPANQKLTDVSVGKDFRCVVSEYGKVYCKYFNYNQPEIQGVTQVSAGWYHVCAINEGQVICWGSNEGHQLSVPSLQNVRQISAGARHTCALDESGVQCWGLNDQGQTNVSDLSNPIQISSGTNHSCALTDREVICWGDNSYGQSTVPTNLNHPRQISAGGSHTCALDDDGVKCWGSDEFGQIAVPLLKYPVSVSAGAGHTCAVDDHGVQCWGDHRGSQLNVPAALIIP